MRIMVCKRVEDFADGYIPCVSSQRKLCSYCNHPVWVSDGCVELLEEPDGADIRTTCEVCYPAAKGTLKNVSMAVAPTMGRDMPPAIRAFARSLGLTDADLNGIAKRMPVGELDRRLHKLTKKRGNS